MNFWTILIVTLIAVAFFAVAMSLTLIFKGHHIKSEVSDNPAMQKLGISCPVKEATQADCLDNTFDNTLGCEDCKTQCQSHH